MKRDFAAAPPLKLREEVVNRLLREMLSQTVLPEGVKLTIRYGEVSHVKETYREAMGRKSLIWSPPSQTSDRQHILLNYLHKPPGRQAD